MGPGSFFPANPDLAIMLGNMDLDFDNFDFLRYVWFQISGFSGSQISKIWPGRGLGRAWAWAWDHEQNVNRVEPKTVGGFASHQLIGTLPTLWARQMFLLEI